MTEVKLYTTPTCAYCKLAKAYFQEKNIPYTEVNVAEDENAQQEMIQKSGQLGVPVLEVGGQILVGWNEKEFAAAYSKSHS